MKDFFLKLKIPTILGLGIIILGIVSGVILTLRGQIFTSQASPNVSPQNITVTNISDTEVSVSWQTSTAVTSFITFGQTSPGESTVLDDRDSNPPGTGPKAHLVHYVTLKNLLPKTTYLYRIFSGKISSDTNNFVTAAPLSQQAGFRPIIGSVFDGNNPLEEGIVYLSIADATTQSAMVKTSGNFLIPVSQIRKTDLSDSFPLSEDTLVKLTIVSPKGQATAQFRLKDTGDGLPRIHLGENLDLTNLSPLTTSPAPCTASKQDLDKYDLNSDGCINAADNSIILENQGKNPKNKKADLNGDGEVNQEDLDKMAKKINQ